MGIGMAGVPERWQRAMRASGYSSIRSLAKDAGMSTTSVSNIITGLRTPLESSKAKLLGVLTKLDQDTPMDEAGFHKLVTGTDADVEPFHLPQGSETLNPRQREAVTKVVLAFLEDNRAAGTEEDDVRDDRKDPDDVGSDAVAGEKNVVRLRPPKPHLAAARERPGAPKKPNRPE
jgi:hypothetical protein